MSDAKRYNLFKTHEELCRQALELMKLKNQDYGATDDPFANFHDFGELGIMVRLGDKFARLKSFLQKGFVAVASESIKDTIIDGINYLVLLYAYLESKQKLPLS